ncbi:MAG: NBR1-Ig-like domain-containing protein [Anaerolineales bacterium]
MNQRHTLQLATTVLLALLLSACGGGETGASSAVLTEAAIIYSQSLTETAAAASPTPTATIEQPTATNTTLPTSTPTVTGTPPTPTPAPTQQATSSSGGGNGACLRANFEIETIPDGTQMFVGKVFTKMWRVKNIGSCTWTPNFAAIWVQGELFAAESVTQFTEVDIFPGEYAEIEVKMVAPSPAGHYKGYWMLRSDDGRLFGVGPRGTDWLWVDIESLPSQ